MENATSAVPAIEEEVEKVGGDLGNDSVKAVLDAKNFVTIKNTVSRRMLSEKAKNNLDYNSDSDSQEQKRELKGLDVIVQKHGFEPERFFIGENAILAGENETVVGTEKADNDYIHIPLLSVLAYRTPKSKKYKKMALCCGLPIKQFTKENRKKMKARIEGKYDITILDGDGNPTRTVTLDIIKVQVVAEGTTVLVNQMFNEDATGIRREELGAGEFAVCDIGAFTTDLAVIKNGKPVSDASDGLPEGISTYISRIAETLSSTTKANITRNQILQKILDDEIDFISIRGKKYPLRQEVDSQLNLLAKKIVDTVDRIWAINYEIQEFFMVGGGAILLKPYIEKHLAGKDFAVTFIEPKNRSDIQNDPQLQNAFGYWKVIQNIPV